MGLAGPMPLCEARSLNLQLTPGRQASLKEGDLLGDVLLCQFSLFARQRGFSCRVRICPSYSSICIGRGAADGDTRWTSLL